MLPEYGRGIREIKPGVDYFLLLTAPVIKEDPCVIRVYRVVKAHVRD
jgi:hypothetical protein